MEVRHDHDPTHDTTGAGTGRGISGCHRNRTVPIEMAEAIHTFVKDRQGDVSPDEILNILQTYDRDRNRLPEAAAATVAAIVNISVKSVASLKRVFEFLKLPDGPNRPDCRGIFLPIISTIGSSCKSSTTCWRNRRRTKN